MPTPPSAAIPGASPEGAGAFRPLIEQHGKGFSPGPSLPNNSSLLVIGDVSGKDMPAAMMVSLLVGTFRTLAHYSQSPGEIMNQRQPSFAAIAEPAPGFA